MSIGRHPLGMVSLAVGFLALSCVSGDREGEVRTDALPDGTAAGEVLQWDGTQWAPSAAGSGTVTQVDAAGGPTTGAGPSRRPAPSASPTAA